MGHIRSTGHSEPLAELANGKSLACALYDNFQ